MAINRRNFLKIAGVTGGGLMVSFYLPMCSPKRDTQTFAPNIFIKILSDNRIILRIPNQEMGQGVMTSLPMLLAEELDVDWGKIETEFLNYDANIPNNKENGGIQDTGGSTAIHANWMRLREAGATVRKMLIETASNEWNIDAKSCSTENGFVINQSTGKKLAYGELAQAASQMEVPDNAPLKDAKDFKLIGKAKVDLKARKVVTGSLKYGMDVRVPEMVYAAMVMIPVRKGKVVSYDANGALAIDGVMRVVEVEQYDGLENTEDFKGITGGLAVVANSTWAAFQGRKALEGKVAWDLGEYGQKDMESLRKDFEKALAGKLNENYSTGDISNSFHDTSKELTATYESPYLPHALMEPLGAIVHVQENKCDIWAGSQSPHLTSVYLSEILGIDPDFVTFHTYPMGGGFGRRYFTDFVGQAALISQKIGKPVKLTWTREDEIRGGGYHPFRQDHYRGSLDKNNNLAAMHFRGITTHIWGATSSPLYHIPNIREESVILDSIVEYGSWRSVVFHNQTLGLECFIDEMAHLAKRDPLEFRLSHLEKAWEMIKDNTSDEGTILGNKKVIPRYIEVLKVIKEKSGWGRDLPENHGLGLAINDLGHGGAQSGWNRTVSAQVAHVSVQNGKWKLHKVTCVFCCGMIVNPNGVKAQIEGSINWALTPVIYGGVTVKNGRVQESNFHDLKVLRIPDAPEVEIHIIPSNELPSGAGEPAVPTLAPAVLNALFAASGKRVRKLPVVEFGYDFN